MRSSHFVRFFTCIASCLSMARAFSVTVGTPTQCDGLTVSWTGGQAPFDILLTPSFIPFQNISVPASAFSNGKGSYTISPLTLAAETAFVLTMSDATGFGSGGTTNQLTVGNSITNNNCDTTPISTPYTFSLSPPQPVQCGPITFQSYAGAILPVTIVQLIPGGQSVVFNSVNSETFSPIVNVNAGTDVIFFMTDFEGRPGGVSKFLPVSASSDALCLSANSPSSTSGIAATASASASSTSSSSSSSSNNTAVIAGAAAGGAVVLILVILAICLLRRRKRKASRAKSSDVKPSKRRSDRPQRGDPESKSHSDIAPQIPPPPKKKPISSRTKAQRSPKTQSNMANSSAGNFAVTAPPTPFSPTQHARQSSNTDLPVNGDSRNSTTMPSPYDRIVAMTQSTSPTYPLPYPVSYPTPPIQPGSQSPPPNAYTGNFTASDHPTLFNQSLHSRQNLNADFAVPEDAQSSAMSSIDRPISAVPETTRQIDPVSYPDLPIHSGSPTTPIHASAGDLPTPPASKPRSKANKSSKSQLQDPSSPEAAPPAKKSRTKLRPDVASETQVQDPSSPEAAPPAKKPRKARPAVASESQVQDPSSPAAAPSVSGSTAPSEDSTSLPRKKKKVTRPESPLTGTGAEGVETPALKSPRKAKASSKTAKSASAPKKEKEM